MSKTKGCLGCTERHVICHATCSVYAEYKSENDALREKIKAIKDE